MDKEKKIDFSLFMQSLANDPRTAQIYLKAKSGQFHYLYFSFMGWLSVNHTGRLSKKKIQALSQTCQSWHSGITCTLSKLARSMSVETIQQSLAEETHKILDFAFTAELKILEESAPSIRGKEKTDKQKISDFCHNMCTYITSTALKFSQEDRQDTLLLLSHCFNRKNHLLIEQKLSDAMLQAGIKITRTEQLTLADL